MLDILPAPDHVGAYRLSGTLVETDLDRLIADLEPRLARHRRVGLFADMTGFERFTFGAWLRDMHYGLSKLGELKRFPREAVVTDKKWLANIAEMAGPLVPHVAIKVFEPEQAAAPLAWVGDFDPAAGA